MEHSQHLSYPQSEMLSVVSPLLDEHKPDWAAIRDEAADVLFAQSDTENWNMQPMGAQLLLSLTSNESSDDPILEAEKHNMMFTSSFLKVLIKHQLPEQYCDLDDLHTTDIEEAGWAVCGNLEHSSRLTSALDALAPFGIPDIGTMSWPSILRLRHSNNVHAFRNLVVSSSKVRDSSDLEDLSGHVADVLWKSFERANERPITVFIRGVLGNLPIPPVNPFSIYTSLKDLTRSIAERPKIRHVGFLLELRKAAGEQNKSHYPAAELVPFGRPYDGAEGSRWLSNAFGDPYKRLLETAAPELIKTMMGQKRYCLAYTDQGLCRNPAGSGTAHAGTGPCSQHDRSPVG